MAAVAIAQWIGAHKLVTAHLYGHDLVMPIEHPLGPILELFPNYNRPLALAAQAVAEHNGSNPHLIVVDVGANIGETVAIIEENCGAIGQYLCIEADRELAELCKTNFQSNGRVRVEQCLIGENEGMRAWLERDGRSNPSTRLINPSSTASSRDKIVRLDTVAAQFAEAHGALDLIKVDTEGFDFSVLRSAAQMLQEYRPALYFEWFPKLLSEFEEEPSAGFAQIMRLGYGYYVFFTNRGDYYCLSNEPDTTVLRELEAVTLRRGPIKYFDVFATTDKRTRDRLVELSASTSG
jgi:FkbM family methyltransferase